MILPKNDYANLGDSNSGWPELYEVNVYLEDQAPDTYVCSHFAAMCELMRVFEVEGNACGYRVAMYDDTNGEYKQQVIQARACTAPSEVYAKLKAKQMMRDQIDNAFDKSRNNKDSGDHPGLDD
jgi:hypothetical protein